MSLARTADLWWKNAVFYCLDVETFLDTDGDGFGDFNGLTDRVDYLAGLGVDCLWLMPFHPSPNRDDGYDVVDYYGVDPRLGTLGDFVVFVRAAKDRGMRVIIDLVVNHTSDRHPWFRNARTGRNARFRDFYVWRDEPSDQPDASIVFPDAEDSIWTHDAKTDQWYLHHFYSHQPDLNIGNPEVREEISRIAAFWLELGVDGFRIDAVPFLVETGGIPGDVDLDPHQLLKELRSFVLRRRGSSLLMGEVNLPPKQLVTYFGDEPGDQIQMLFNFPLMQSMYLSLAREDATPVARILGDMPEIPEEGQWAVFVRNHDELTLDQLTEKQRQEVFEAFGPFEDMQLYGRGIRRRLPPMVSGHPQRQRFVYSLLFALPGSPVLLYGEEIGMGENLEVPGRVSVRTPMQWTDGKNAGFSTASPSRLRRSLPDGEFGPLAVNVAEQQRDSESLLNTIERMIRRRRETPEFGWGKPRLLETGDAAVLAHRVDWEGRSVLAVHNFSSGPRVVTLEVGEPDEEIVLSDLLEFGADSLDVGDGEIELKLEGYGYRWLRIQPAGQQTIP